MPKIGPGRRTRRMVFLAGRERRVLIKGFAGRYPRSRGDLLCECGAEWRGIVVGGWRTPTQAEGGVCTCSGDCTQWVRVPRMRAAPSLLHACTFLRDLQCTVAEPVYALAICTWRSRWLTNKREGNRVVKTTKIKEKRKKEYTIRRKITSLATYVIFRKIIYLRKFELTWERSFVSVQFVVRNESDLRQTRVSCGV